MRAVAVATAAVLWVPAFAFAQGGGGVLNPAPALTIEARPPRQDTGSVATPGFDGPLLAFDNATLPAGGTEAPVQTLNSLPRGAAFTSSPAALDMGGAHGETVEPGHLAPNNGSGISQTAASMPPGAMKDTLPQMNAEANAKYQAAQKDRRLAAVRAREARRPAAPSRLLVTAPGGPGAPL